MRIDARFILIISEQAGNVEMTMLIRHRVSQAFWAHVSDTMHIVKPKDNTGESNRDVSQSNARGWIQIANEREIRHGILSMPWFVLVIFAHESKRYERMIQAVKMGWAVQMIYLSNNAIFNRPLTQRSHMVTFSVNAWVKCGRRRPTGLGSSSSGSHHTVDDNAPYAVCPDQ